MTALQLAGEASCAGSRFVAGRDHYSASPTNGKVDGVLHGGAAGPGPRQGSD